MYNLDVVYHNGLGVPQDYAKAREWWEKAAAKDKANAMYNLGVLCQGVARDYAKAREWWEKAAARGDADAKIALEQLSAGNTLLPHNLQIESDQPHALTFMGHDEEDKALYLAHKGEVSELSGKLWEQGIAEDFAKLRAGRA